MRLASRGLGADEPLTRRQIREFERLTGSDIQEEPVSTSTTSFEVRLPYDDDLVEQIPELANTNAVEIVDRFPKDQKIIFVPDRNLGDYVARQTGREETMILWQGWSGRRRITAG